MAVMRLHSNRAIEQLKNAKKVALQEELQKLPLSIQMTVENCFANGAVPKKQRRYTLEWTFQSILIKLKGGGSAYKQIRNTGILPLPCPNTIDNYLKNLDYDVGFKQVVFDTMKFRGQNLKDYEKNGQC